MQQKQGTNFYTQLYQNDGIDSIQAKTVEHLAKASGSFLLQGSRISNQKRMKLNG